MGEHELQVAVEEVSELSALELQNAIKDQSSPESVGVEKKTRELPPGKAGEGSLVDLLILYGPDVIPPLSAAIAGWIAAGRKRKTTRAKKIVVSEEQVVIAELDIEELERTDSTEAMASVIEGLLGSTKK